MEMLGIDPSFWRGRSVFLTGHTGFKGGWLAHWLCDLGAKVHGYSMQPPTATNFFTEARVAGRLETSVIGNILDMARLKTALEASNAEIVFHLAAQPLVRKSYEEPLETLATNVIGTANVLTACCHFDSIAAIVNVTSDKCYENREWVWPYRETDPLGGYDPYSASKACAEIVTCAYRNSFFAARGLQLASARSGNVIGGGDWATGRLIPDFLRAVDSGEVLRLRSPDAVRPWQHVLEPLCGYLTLAEKLCAEQGGYSDAWNFGPNDGDAKSVGWIVNELCDRIDGGQYSTEGQEQLHEADLLSLDSSKARAVLGWAPRWGLETALSKTLEWHEAWRSEADMADFTCRQIQAYVDG